MTKICVIGASLGWVPCLVSDLIALFADPLEIRLHDIDPEAMELCAEWGRKANRVNRRKDKYRKCPDRKEALKDADAVIITISTGGLDAMEHDIKIPEKYGIYATVGDTAGAGGWSRAIRNIPVFRKFAVDCNKYCPRAFIANYTNPLSALTAVLQHECGNPSVGLCHAYFETKDVIQKIFGLPDWGRMAVEIAGMNHFTWVVKFSIGREDGYELLKKKIGRGSLKDLVKDESYDEIGFSSNHELFLELLEMFGYMPYPGTRHICEFLPFTVSNSPEKHDTLFKGKVFETIKYCNMRRTSIEARREGRQKYKESFLRYLRDKKTVKARKSREKGVDMIHGYLNNKPVVDVVNVLNRGQVPGLPPDACVETLGVVDGLGVRPLFVGGVPEHLLEIMRPQAVCQKWIVEGMLKNDRDMLLHALYRDPQCAHLKPHEVRNMAEELFKANAKYKCLAK